MPRYAKGSIESALFQALKKESNHDVKGLRERINSKRSRAHRLEALPEPAKTPVEKARVIVQMSRLYDAGFMSPETLLLVCTDVIKGD